MAFQNFVDIGNGLVAPGAVGEIRIRRTATGLEISIDGAAFTALGGFGADTLLQLPDIALTPVNALEIITALTSNGVGTATAAMVFKLLATGNVQAVTLTVDNQGIALADGSNAAAAIRFASDPGKNTGWNYAGAGIWAFVSAAQLMGRIGPIGTGWTFFDRAQEARGSDVAVAAGVLTLGNANFFQVTSAGAVDFITTTAWGDGPRVELLCTVGCTFNHNTGSPPVNTFPLNMISGGATAKAAGGVIAFRRSLASNRWQQVA